MVMPRSDLVRRKMASALAKGSDLVGFCSVGSVSVMRKIYHIWQVGGADARRLWDGG